MTRSSLLILAFLILLPQSQSFGESYRTYLKPLTIKSTKTIKPTYDVIVAGTDPEGIVAAISAARNNLKVLLVDGKNRRKLGGLMTLGWLNTLDLNKSPVVNKKYPSPYLNGGIFQEWFNLIEGTSFDVERATNAFHNLTLSEPNIDILMNVKVMQPVVANNAVTGMRIVKEDGKEINVNAVSIIDATQDADIAAAAGAPFTWGWKDIGEPNAQMAVTLVFKLSGVTDAIWQELSHKVGSDSRSIWGYKEVKKYQSSNPTRVKMRGLNIGREDNGTILINSMQIYGVNPLDPASVQEGMRIGAKEAPLIVDYLKKNYKGFRKLKYAGVAPELYIRESRHIEGEYRLTMADLMNNRDQWDAIAYGSYEVDIQSIAYNIGGSVVMHPMQYGVPFRSIVPKKVDGLLVVGRSASFDTLPHGSARVIPLGMATGEAAGVAAKLAKERKLTFRQLSKSKESIEELQNRLTKQGMDLRVRPFEKPEYMKGSAYPGLLTAVSLYVATGGYENAWKLDEPAKKKKLANIINRLKKMYPDKFPNKQSFDHSTKEEPISLDLLTSRITEVAGMTHKGGSSTDFMLRSKWLNKKTLDEIKNKDRLTVGELYKLIRDFMDYYLHVTFK
ncbi:FAD-dependent oxidoreductase [Cohnella abietis]|uniref:FAD-dependent oxidoreductase n=1 Tax=Cohnella abietis TaxID=2507935 RepID=UPI001E5F3A10|nr:FAD-dependent oxidoreductase [Cohnella abietis]